MSTTILSPKGFSRCSSVQFNPLLSQLYEAELKIASISETDVLSLIFFQGCHPIVFWHFWILIHKFQMAIIKGLGVWNYLAVVLEFKTIVWKQKCEKKLSLSFLVILHFLLFPLWQQYYPWSFSISFIVFSFVFFNLLHFHFWPPTK